MAEISGSAGGTYNEFCPWERLGFDVQAKQDLNPPGQVTQSKNLINLIERSLLIYFVMMA